MCIAEAFMSNIFNIFILVELMRGCMVCNLSQGSALLDCTSGGNMNVSVLNCLCILVYLLTFDSHNLSLTSLIIFSGLFPDIIQLFGALPTYIDSHAC